MIRNGLAFLFATSAVAGIGLMACGKVLEGPIIQGIDAGPTIALSGPPGCIGQCCPQKPICYSDPTKGISSPGAECLATRDNTPTPKRLQMRQTWLYPTSPAGLLQSVVYQSLNSFTTLPWQECGQHGGSGYIELVDFDLDKGIARVGFSTFLALGLASDAVLTPAQTAEQNAKVESAIKDGACMARAEGWNGTAIFTDGSKKDLSIPQADIYTSAALKVPVSPGSTTYATYPKGLPEPMGQPWTMGPAVTKRIKHDFKLTDPPIPELAPGADGDAGTGATVDLKQWKTQREELLARLAADGDLGKAGFTGVFYWDDNTKHTHGFSPIGWQVLYDAYKPDIYQLIPIREAEINSDFDDQHHPNCVGEYNGKTLETSACSEGSVPDTNNPWTGPDGVQGKSPATTEGYFLIVELEQIWSNVLKQSLCYVYPTGKLSAQGGWGTDTSKLCRSNPDFLPDAFGEPDKTKPGPVWKPSDPINGIPKGDWCSLDNTAAHDTCHDAYRTVAYQTFAASNVRDGTCEAASTDLNPTPAPKPTPAP